MIPLDIQCNRCQASLMDPNHPIDGQPSVHLLLHHDGRNGEVWLSGLYGSDRIECTLEIPNGEIVDLYCPACKRRFRPTRQCEKCAAPMTNLGIQEAGEVVVCCRYGCKNHLLEFSDVSGAFKEFYEAYSPFFARRPTSDPDSEPRDL